MLIATACVVACFATIHLFAGRLRFLSVVPRSRWLSMAGGISVAYVFIHLLPELAERREHLERAAGAELTVYIFALIGLIVFYGLERMVKQAKREHGHGSAVFWLHIGSFALYNLLIGYLTLHREVSGPTALVFYAIAFSLHFLTNDFGLRQDHAQVYDRQGRWLLTAAVVLGWVIGIMVDIPPSQIAALFAFLSGGTILNVLKEELPEERESRFSAFLTGAAGYTVLLLLAG